MRIQQIKTISGPNVFHYRPILLATIDLGEWAESHSAAIPGFSERLLAILPGLHEHRCSVGRPGGFEKRLARGTYLAHVIEHVAIELSGLAGISVGYGKTVMTETPGVYRVAIRYRNEEGMKFLLHAGLALTQAALEGKGFDVQGSVERAKAIIRETELGPSTRAILDAATKRGIPWKRIGAESLVQLGYGIHRRFIQATTTGRTSDIAVDIAQNKELTKDLLRRAALPVPRGEVVRSEAEAVAAWRAVGAPVAVKPLDSHHGNGVSLGIDDEAAVRDAFLFASQHSGQVMVEEYFPGKDLRVLVVDGKYVAAAHRTPAFVIGDGRSTLLALIDRENESPLRGDGHEKPLTRITKDAALLSFLRRRGMFLELVPSAGEIVTLRETANLSTGGCAIDLTDELHPSLRRICEVASRVVGLDVSGVDLIVEDPSLPFTDQKAVILEVNAGPGIRMHHHPSGGKARGVGEVIVDYLFPGNTSGRIPTASITGTNGKTTVARLMAHLLDGAGKVTGLTTSDGIFVGGEQISYGDTTGPRSAEAVLSNPMVEVAVLETARGGIVRNGLGYDWSDVGILTNIQLDHIGQDGIETLEDIVRIKALVAERVREGGTLILNAEDPNLLRLAESPAVRGIPKKLVLISLNPEQIALRRHLSQGGTAYFMRGDMLVEAGPEGEVPFLRAADVPLTFGGTARFHVANVLAAVAGARALGLSLETLTASLGSFHPNRKNAGRTNLFRAGKGYLLIDYGHNPEAFRAIADMTEAWHSRRVTGIIGLPGDRSNGMIQTSAKVAARGFDRIFVREDTDRRGRQPGETAELICQAVHDEAPGLSCVVEPIGSKCLEQALAEMEPGEVIVYFYEDLDDVDRVVKTHGAEPVDDVRAVFGGKGLEEAV